MSFFLSALKWGAIVGAVSLVLTLLRPLLNRKYQARWRYWVWLILAAALCLAPLEPLLPELSKTPAPVVIEVPQVEWSVGRQPVVDLQDIPAPSSPQVMVSQEQPAQRDVVPVPVPVPEGPQGSAPPEQPIVTTIRAGSVIPIVWLTWAAVFLLYRLTGTALFYRKAKRWSLPVSPETMEVYQSARAALGISPSRGLDIAVSFAVSTPMVVGFFRPMLFLPPVEFQSQDLNFILRHELTHFKRRDLWYKLLLLTANALHWFNPLVYLLRHEAAGDLELTCDDSVVAGADTLTRQAYSETLLASLHGQQKRGQIAISTQFYGGTKLMKDRFRNLLGGGRRKFGWIALCIALIVTLTAACTVGLQQESDEDPADAETVEERLYDRVEEIAQEKLDDAYVQSIGTGTRSPEILERSISDLYLVESYQIGEKNYSVWYAFFKLLCDDFKYSIDYDWEILSSTDNGDTENRVVTAKDSPVELLIIEDEAGNVSSTNCWGHSYYTWEEYILCHTVLGMKLSSVLNGWPVSSQPAERPSSLESPEQSDLKLSNALSNYLYPFEPKFTNYADHVSLVAEFEPDYLDFDRSLLLEITSNDYSDSMLILMNHVMPDYPDNKSFQWRVAGTLHSYDLSLLGDYVQPVKLELPSVSTSQSSSGDDYASEFAAQYVNQIINSIQEEGIPIDDSRVSTELEGAYTFDFFDREIEVWSIQYQLHLSNPDDWRKIHSDPIQKLGIYDIEWVTDYAPHYFAVAVDHSEGTDVPYELLGYSSWETVDQHYCSYEVWAVSLLLGIMPPDTPWPGTTSDIHPARNEGEYQWLSDLETTVQRYAREELGWRKCNLSPLLSIKYPGIANQLMYQFVMINNDAGQTGAVLLYNTIVSLGEDPQSFWQVIGVQYSDEVSEEFLSELSDYFHDYRHDGLLRFAYSNMKDVEYYFTWLFSQPATYTFTMTDEEVEALPWPAGFNLRRANFYYFADFFDDNFGLGYSYNFAAPLIELLDTRPGYDITKINTENIKTRTYTFTSGTRLSSGIYYLYYTAEYLYDYNEESGEAELFTNVPMRLSIAPNGDGGWYCLQNLRCDT